MRKSDEVIVRMQCALEPCGYNLDVHWNTDGFYEAFITDTEDKPVTKYQGKGHRRIEAVADALIQTLLIKTRAIKTK